MKLTITTLVIIEDNEVQDIIHSFKEDLAETKQEIIDQVNEGYSDGTEPYKTIEEILESFTSKYDESQGSAHIETQVITFKLGSTAIQKYPSNPY